MNEQPQEDQEELPLRDVPSIEITSTEDTCLIIFVNIIVILRLG